MKLTIIQTGDVPEPLRPRFAPYGAMFAAMFARSGRDFVCQTVRLLEGEPLPDPASLEGVVITGSAAGVYEDHAWLTPLRAFIRGAYAARTPMLGVCFGHQIMADALGGAVRKSEKGWGLGRHVYANRDDGGLLAGAGAAVGIACSHQDQVITAPASARVILSSAFTPNAGLLYESGRALSVQPHPEFDDDYATALVELRRGRVPDDVVDAALASMRRPSDSPRMIEAITRFFLGA